MIPYGSYQQNNKTKCTDDDILSNVGFRIWCEQHLPLINIISNNKFNMKNFLLFVLHSVVGTVILAGVSLLISVHPAWFSATIGSLIVNFYSYLVALKGTTSISYK